MKQISYSDGRVIPSKICIWDDLHTERRGNWYRAFWGNEDETSGSPVFGYCDSKGGPHRTIQACAREVLRFYPNEKIIFRNGKEIKVK